MSVVQVTILGQRYAVRSDLDPGYIGEVAGYLDDRMRRAASELSTADPLRVAVLAALNVTDDLFRARAASQGAEGQLHARTRAIEALMDAVLGGPASPIVRTAVND